jgi:pyruvate/2-oxoglutarate/acetoin dehydrogenase E1 component
MSRDEPKTVAESVRKTSKVIVAHEDLLSWGYGAEIAGCPTCRA